MNYKQILRQTARLASLLLAVGIVACSSDDEPAVGPDTKSPTIELTQGAVTATTLTVKIEAENAEKCYIDYVVKGESEPTAEQVIASGKEIQAGNCTLQELTAETTYVVVAVAVAGDQQASDRLEATTAAESATEVETMELNILRQATYRSGDASGNGNYQIVISNATELAWEGDAEMILDFYNEPDADPLNAVLPNGTYEASAERAPFTYNPDLTYITLVRDGQLSASPVLGSITVEREGPNYSIFVEGELFVDQTPVRVSYEGPIQFVESVTAEWTPFEEAQEVTFERVQGRYWGGWFYPFADDIGLEFFEGEFNEDRQQVEGYYIQLSNLYIEKLLDYTSNDIEIPNGTYTVVSKDNYFYINSYAQPFTFDYGYQMDFYGTMLDVGTYVTYINQEENIYQRGYITGGTITVSGSASAYTFQFDLVTEEGVSIKATYEGGVELVNYNDNDQNEIWKLRPWTTLTEDHTCTWKPETTAYAFLEGEYIKAGYDTWLVMIMASNEEYPNGYGDFFTTELLVPVGGELEFPTGTFDITWELGANVMIPGYMSFSGEVCFTHYGDLTPDAEGYSAAQAALESGTVTISKEGDEYKFVFDAVDGLGNKITGEWQGAVIVDDLRPEFEEGSGDGDHDHDHDHAHTHAVKQPLQVRR